MLIDDTMSPQTLFWEDISKALLNQLPAIIIAATGLMIAWTKLADQISKARHQSQEEHDKTMAKVEDVGKVAEETRHSLNSQLDEWKRDFKKATDEATHAAKMASDAAVLAAHAAGVSQGQGDAARITALIPPVATQTDRIEQTGADTNERVQKVETKLKNKS